MNEVSSDGRSGLLVGKVALVIGASRGIGAATAKAPARAGAKVMLAARDANALETVVGEIRIEEHNARFVAVDIGTVVDHGHRSSAPHGINLRNGDQCWASNSFITQLSFSLERPSQHSVCGTPARVFWEKSAVPMNESSLSIRRRPHDFVRQFSSEAISKVKELPNDFTA